MFRSHDRNGIVGIAIAVPTHDNWLWESTERDGSVECSANGTVPNTVSELLSRYQVVQIAAGDCSFPSREYVYDRGMRPFERYIKHTDIGLIYSPDALDSGGLLNGVLKGTNVFLLFGGDCPSIEEELQRLKADQDWANATRAFDDLFDDLFRLAHIEGYVVQQGMQWQFVHKDPLVLDSILSIVFRRMYAKQFKINNRTLPKDFVFPSHDQLGIEQHKSSKKGCYVQIYFEQDSIVAHSRSEKKRTTVATGLAVTPHVPGTEATGARVWRWLLPEIVPDRAFYRKSLLRFSVQYLCTAVYLSGLVVLMVGLSDSVPDAIPDMWFQVPSAILGFLVLLSLLASLSYLAHAIFGGKRTLRSRPRSAT